MGKITDIRGGRQRGKRVNIYIDGQFSLAVDLEIAVKEKLKVGTDIDSDRIAEVGKQDRIHRCYDAAVRFLGYRPRSEAELRDRLHRRGFSQDDIEPAIIKLGEQGLVNDNVFAQFWTENRESFSPRSRYLTMLELRKKGVAEEVISRTIADINDEESAYRTAITRVSRLHFSDRQDLRKRLGDYLRRRGFSYETINRTIEKIWQERQE